MFKVFKVKNKKKIETVDKQSLPPILLFSSNFVPDYCITHNLLKIY